MGYGRQEHRDPGLLEAAASTLKPPPAAATAWRASRSPPRSGSRSTKLAALLLTGAEFVDVAVGCAEVAPARTTIVDVPAE